MNPRPFYLGLNMAGTVSAGAYTAGVMDFLIEAMDAWYAERARQQQQFGDQYDKWTIPPHDLQLAVMTGASGGGITAALSAAALSQPFDAIHNQSPGPGDKLNNLFRAWVAEIDLQPLLGHADLDAQAGKPVSLLDSTPIQDIAAKALAVSNPLPAIRPWVRDGMQVTLTLTNLGGVPYAVEPQTAADSARTLYYGDRQDFSVLWSNLPTGSVAMRLDARVGGWTTLAQAAVATSAFPIVLAPQALSRTAGEYNHRLWRIPKDHPQCDGNGRCLCEENKEMPPQWKEADAEVLHTLNVDGGATNNSPFDCARLALAALEPQQLSGHNRRDPRFADRAVVNIAPLSSPAKAGAPPLPATDLPSLLGGLVQVLLTQSRMQGENLKLTSDEATASRWVIAPTPELADKEPLAGALVGAFGGFISRLFREHDYQLGRRNCQRFLTRYFGLPWDNAIMQQYNLSAATVDRLMADQYGFPSETTPPVPLFALIPVRPSLRDPVQVVRNAIKEDDLKDLGDLAVDRIKRVTKGLDLVPDWVVNLAFPFFKGKIRDAIVERARTELASQGFLS